MAEQQKQLESLLIAADISPRLRPALEFGVVVAVIMTLTAFSLASIDRYIVRSQISEAIFLTSTIKADLIEYRAANGQWPESESAVANGTLLDKFVPSRYVARVDLSDNGSFSVFFNSELPVAESIAGKQLTFRPGTMSAELNAPVAWFCAGRQPAESIQFQSEDHTNIERNLLPSACWE